MKSTLMKHISIIVLFSFFASVVYAQQLKLLKQIGTEVNSKTGVGQTYYGQLMTTGEVYFQASKDGFYDEIWKTDGTANGTQMVLTTQGNGGWSIPEFKNEGFFINTDDDDLRWFEVTTDQATELGHFPGINFQGSGKIDENLFIIKAYEDTTAQWWITDKTAAGTSLLGNIGKQNGFLEMFTSDYGAVMYTTNAFITYEPVFYNKANDTIITVKDFLAPFQEFSKIRSVFLYENLMFVSVKEGNFDKNYIFDLATNEFHPTPYTEEMIAFVPYQDELILLTRRYLIIVDRTTYQVQTITDNVYPFSNYLLDGDRFYYIFDEDNKPAIYYIDLTDRTNHPLPDGEIGLNHYSNTMAAYHNAIYYTKREHPSTFLRKFDLTNQQTTIIDTIAVKNGSLTIDNALQVVNNVLVTSRYSQSKGHELYYLDETTSTLFPYQQMSQLKVYPNPCFNYIQLDPEENAEGQISIYNTAGKLLLFDVAVKNIINTETLLPGFYYGIYNDGKQVLSFRFTKL
jgi:ELWxxDGT repeat protein